MPRQNSPKNYWNDSSCKNLRLCGTNPQTYIIRNLPKNGKIHFFLLQKDYAWLLAKNPHFFARFAIIRNKQQYIYIDEQRQTFILRKPQRMPRSVNGDEFVYHVLDSMSRT